MSVSLLEKNRLDEHEIRAGLSFFFSSRDISISMDMQVLGGVQKWGHELDCWIKSADEVWSLSKNQDLHVYREEYDIYCYKRLPLKGLNSHSSLLYLLVSV